MDVSSRTKGQTAFETLSPQGRRDRYRHDHPANEGALRRSECPYGALDRPASVRSEHRPVDGGLVLVVNEPVEFVGRAPLDDPLEAVMGGPLRMGALVDGGSPQRGGARPGGRPR